jgi:LysR family transcriptional activator of mexEF-oprN operon
MGPIQSTYGRDLDLNLLRVFAVVADEGSVTAAAARLYLSQPALSAAIKRLTAAVGAPLFARRGRGLALTPRGERLAARVRPHLDGLVEAALSPPAFDPTTNDSTIRIGLSDDAESWLLPPLLRALEKQAPQLRLVVMAVQFRTVGELLARRQIDLAVTVTDELPAGIRRQRLPPVGLTCVFDPRHVRLPRKVTLARYLEQVHVIVSYNGDLRGVVEDYLGVERRVRVSVSSFSSVGSIVRTSTDLVTSQQARSIARYPPPFRRLSLAQLARSAACFFGRTRFPAASRIGMTGSVSSTTSPSRRATPSAMPMAFS